MLLKNPVSLFVNYPILGHMIGKQQKETIERYVYLIIT